MPPPYLGCNPNHINVSIEYAAFQIGFIIQVIHKIYNFRLTGNRGDFNPAVVSNAREIIKTMIPTNRSARTTRFALYCRFIGTIRQVFTVYILLSKTLTQKRIIPEFYGTWKRPEHTLRHGWTAIKTVILGQGFLFEITIWHFVVPLLLEKSPFGIWPATMR